MTGCSHDCKYCYSKEMAIRFKRSTPFTWKYEQVNTKKLEKSIKKYSGRVMFPSSHDITPQNLDIIMDFLSKLLIMKNEILIVSKPHYKCIKKICDNFQGYKKQILFRFTIGFPNSRVLKFWEPNAPSYAERKKSLIYAYDSGFLTSLSIEPALDDIHALKKLIFELSHYVNDSIWIGRPNFLKRRLKTNGEFELNVFNKAEVLEDKLNEKNIERLYKIFKNDGKIKWKESIKKVIGLEISTSPGLDV